MTTYNTGNPIGSTDPRDLYDNAQNLDTAMHTAATTWADRLGNFRPSWAGATGYQSLGDYAAGIQVTTYNQVIRAAGEYWRAAAGTALPYTTTGAGMPESGKFVSVGDAVLRADLVEGDGSSIVGFQQAGSGAIVRTAQAKMRETVSVKDFGAIGDGVTDDTAAIHAAIATGKSVFFPEPDVFYSITDEIGPKFPGQILYSNCRKRGFIRNVTNSNRLAVFGDPSRTDGAAPQSGMRGMYFWGNATTIGGVALPTVLTLGNAGWTDGSKDCILTDCGVDFVGAGWALEVYSWENEIINFTGYEGNLRGAIYADSANQNNTVGLYMTGCDEVSLQIGGDATGRRNRANLFNGVTVQQSGGAEGCLVIADADNTVINGLYSESNNSKGAPYVVFVKDTSSGTRINGMSHLSGGAVVIRNEAVGTAVSTVVSSNITGVIVDNRLGGVLVADNINWIPGVTPTGSKFADNSTAKTGFYIGGDGVSDFTISSFEPLLRFEDRSASVPKIRFRYDQSIMRLEYDADGDGSYSKLLWAFNALGAEFITEGQVRPNTDNARTLGSALRRWSVVYAGTGAINTSDASEKQQVRELSDAERAVAIRLKSLVRAFKFNDAVERKGDGARIHIGVIAQDVQAAFEAEGLSPFSYSLLCYDEWGDEFDDDGNLTIPAGSRYGIRYDELMAFMIAAL